VTQKIVLPNVKYVVAVASGKGGVGKSTTSVNLAAALMQKGLKVGVLDADIYGPSIPRMMAVAGKPQAREDKKLIPHQRYGMAVMSMGFLIAEETPMIWRGPMVHSAITQLFRDVDWGELDVLVVDLPPGTGDAQLTMAQSAPLSGAVIVSTPQDIALIDARKGLAMFQKVDVPVLGIVENMSTFICPHCGQSSDIFSHGGARAEAEKLNVPFLGEIPLDIKVRQKSDEGMPLTLFEPEGDIAKLYRGMADKLWMILTMKDADSKNSDKGL
jgi:ATP-binding protein involved in chromosome partitioning